MTLRLDYISASDRGLVRGNNEDSAYAGPHLLVLADGMGGHAAGEVASQLMVEHLEVLDQDPGSNDMLALIAGAADDANAAIAAAVRNHPEQEGMGTTLTALLFNGSHFALCHVGDSRCYRLRDGVLEQLTVDDTYVQSLVAAGELDPTDISTHPRRSLILKAYTGIPVEPYLSDIPAHAGDRLLLCSDGLTDPVTHETIETALAKGSPADAAEKLIDLALRSGGPDNITVVIADVIDDTGVDQNSRDALPSQPSTAGALLKNVDEDCRPDSSAVRAAALQFKQRQPQHIAPAKPGSAATDTALNDANSLTGAAATATTAAAATGASAIKTPSRFRWAFLISVLILLIAAITSGWFFSQAASNRYYLTVNPAAQNAIVVQRGFDKEILGKPLNSAYQKACLDRSGSLLLASFADPAAACTPFILEDLPAAEREKITTLSAGSYEEIAQQLRDLAAEALPPCVKRDASKGPRSETEGDLSNPGVNCRVVNS
ncbi:PP2C family protein-serine/threonine phosphatase [Corynebacterium caspium]|uniref:PP2C family protein-serine/threonine phosphatase n=1 Tax=Corynebacterium caspium TaxID=234828 RepID=UPI0003825729|nr:protein phosphatase 2C domain-containing protein [Corynebacterium caspium]WKD58478.1 PP2C-family Ser/Thr phosphatase [Corynebacterium caspium DSM 44850]